MGKIYEDIDENVHSGVKDMLDTFSEISSVFASRDDIVHRDSEIDRIYGIMDKIEYRSVLLVGDKGCGKTSIIEGYIKRLEDNCRQDVVFTIDFDDLCESIGSMNDFSRIVNTIVEVSTNNDYTIVNINNIGKILNHSVYGNGGYSFLNKIIFAIKEKNLRIIATATSDEFKDIQDDFPYVVDFFTVIKVNELTKDQTMDILKVDIKEYEKEFKLNLPERTIELVCDNADKYIKDRPFPEKAMQLLDEVCSRIVAKKSSHSKYKETYDKINALKMELHDALEKNDYVKCNSLNDEIDELDNKVKLSQKRQRKTNATEYDVLEAIGGIVGVKMSKLDKNQTSFLKQMSDEIKKSVIGQDDAVDKIVKNIIRNKLGLRKTAHSMGNFIFIGSTGVGKTHLAKQIAKYLYGSEESLLRFDMSEYQSEIDVSKLLGSAPGYVGYKESGLLVKRLAKYPESVVLFDEIEKAHPKIYDVLLQLLDEGFVTGSDGNKVDATKSLIIFTSNIGVRAAKEYGTPLGYSNNVDDMKNKQKEEIIRKALNKRFSPEFLNRLDSICYFNNLDRETLKNILYREISEMNNNIKNICGKKVVLGEDVENWILDKVESEENGARPIIRQLQQNIEEELASMIIEDNDVLKKSEDVLNAFIKDDKIMLN